MGGRAKRGSVPEGWDGRTGERVADAITRFTGSLFSVGFHGAFILCWILLNRGIFPPIKPFDPFPFSILAMIASVEAIFG